MWILTRSYRYQAVKLLGMARGLKFCIWEVEVLYYASSETEGANQLRGYREPDVRLFFAYAERWFSHDSIYQLNRSRLVVKPNFSLSYAPQT